jgi:hypothetical protein
MAPERDDTDARLVLKTGIALLHKGDRIWAEPEAQAQFAVAGAETTIHYHFPVEIEVRGGGEPMDIDAIAGYVYERLAKRLKETA